MILARRVSIYHLSPRLYAKSIKSLLAAAVGLAVLATVLAVRLTLAALLLLLLLLLALCSTTTTTTTTLLL
jgi:hypothetical protein